MPGEIVTAHEAVLLDRDIIAERAEMKRNHEALLALARRTQTPFCGMTSRAAPPYVSVREVKWATYLLPFPMTARASCTEVVHELTAWANWLIRALEVVKYGDRGQPIPVSLREVSANVAPAPPGRVFTAEVWPTLAQGEEKQPGRGRRS